MNDAVPKLAPERGIFLALTVEPPHARDAEAEILRRFPREKVSLEHLMLRAMREEAEARRVQWPKALAADAALRDSADFKNLLRLASRAAPRVKDQVLVLRAPALLTRPGLVARYDLMTSSLQALAIGGPAVPFIGVPVLGHLFGTASTIPISVASLAMNRRAGRSAQGAAAVAHRAPRHVAETDSVAGHIGFELRCAERKFISLKNRRGSDLRKPVQTVAPPRRIIFSAGAGLLAIRTRLRPPDEQRGLQLENAEAERFWTSLQDMNQSTVDALPARRRELRRDRCLGRVEAFGGGLPRES